MDLSLFDNEENDFDDEDDIIFDDSNDIVAEDHGKTLNNKEKKESLEEFLDEISSADDKSVFKSDDEFLKELEQEPNQVLLEVKRERGKKGRRLMTC